METFDKAHTSNQLRNHSFSPTANWFYEISGFSLTDIMTSSSRQLVRKLLKATEDVDFLEKPIKKTKRQRREESVEKEAASVEDVVRTQAKMLLILDRKMASKVDGPISQISNAAGLTKAFNRIEKTSQRQKQPPPPPPAASRSSASQALRVHEPTFNKRKYRQEQEKNKAQELQKALKLLEKQRKK